MGRRPRPTSLLTAAVQHGAAARGVGRGTKRDRRNAVSPSAGLAPRRHPKVLPTPPEPRPRRRSRSPDDPPPPRALPNWPLPWETSPPLLNGHGAGNERVSGPAGTPLPA